MIENLFDSDETIFYRNGVKPKNVFVITYTSMCEDSEAGHDQIFHLLMQIDPQPNIAMKALEKIKTLEGFEQDMDETMVAVLLDYGEEDERLTIFSFVPHDMSTTTH